MKETILLDPMFEIPGSDIVQVKITSDVVCGKNQPEFKRKGTEFSDKSDSNEEMVNGTVRVHI